MESLNGFFRHLIHVFLNRCGTYSYYALGYRLLFSDKKIKNKV